METSADHQSDKWETSGDKPDQTTHSIQSVWETSGDKWGQVGDKPEITRPENRERSGRQTGKSRRQRNQSVVAKIGRPEGSSGDKYKMRSGNPECDKQASAQTCGPEHSEHPESTNEWKTSGDKCTIMRTRALTASRVYWGEKWETR